MSQMHMHGVARARTGCVAAGLPATLRLSAATRDICHRQSIPPAYGEESGVGGQSYPRGNLRATVLADHGAVILDSVVRR